MSKESRGFVVWFTGLSGAGKSTLAEALAPELRALGKRVELLDGDIVRTHFSKGLGFSREDRDLNVARIAFVAHLLARNGVVVLVAAISPFREARELARKTIGDFVEVHVAPPLEECIKRDVKGLYKKALAGEIAQFTGVNDPYEPPAAPELADRYEPQVGRRDRAPAPLDPPRPGPPRTSRAETANGGVTHEPARTMSESRETFLPRFSDPKDIDTFVEMLARFESGEITSEQFRAFRLLRGVYGQRQTDVQMLRVKIPFGRLFPAQLEALADVAERYSRGYGHVTTRQNVQFHFIQMSEVETAMRRLDEAGLTTREACGNSVRTVTACEVAGVCEGAAFDVTPYAEALTRMLLRHPLSSSLPRKFKIAFSGCGRDCAMGAINDLGFVAAVENGERGFKVLAAGGLSTTPQAAIVLHDFVRAGEISRVAETLVRLFHSLGNRENKHRARLKYVLRKLGEASFREEYARRRAEVDAEALAEIDEAPQPATTPAPPVEDDAPRAPGYLAWKASAVFAQKQAGYAAVYVRLPLGDVTSVQLRALGGLATRFGDGSVLLSIDQNLVLPWVDARSLPAIHRALVALDLAELDRGTARDVTSCPGAETCNLAVTGSRSLARAIGDRLAGDEEHALRAFARTTIKISGCPNSCGQHHVADLGFHGAVKNVNGVAVPMYQLHLGGGVDADGARFGRQVVKIIARRVPDAVVALLELFESDAKPGEEPAAFFRRVDPKRVVESLGTLLGPALPGEEADIGETQGFHVAIGAGECAA